MVGKKLKDFAWKGEKMLGCAGLTELRWSCGMLSVFALLYPPSLPQEGTVCCLTAAGVGQ